MLFFYKSPLCRISDHFHVSNSFYLVNTLGFLSSYKERFVISTEMAASLPAPYLSNLRCLFASFFVYDTLLVQMEPLLPLGITALPQDLLYRALRQRRNFLLHFGQRRVCTRSSVWFSSEMWRRWTFDSIDSTARSVSLSRYAYRHLARSDVYKAGSLVSHPNFYLFIYLLTNPYLWGVLQQTLHSHYRYK